MQTQKSTPNKKVQLQRIDDFTEGTILVIADFFFI